MPEFDQIAPLLQDLAQMTGQRTHSCLEVSVITTLLRLPQVHSVGVVDLIQDNGVEQVLYKYRQMGAPQPSAVMEPPVQRIEELRPLDEMAHLRQAITAGRSYCLTSWSDASSQGHSIWLIVWRQQKAIQCIELRQYAPFDAERIQLISSVFQVYQNYQNLLDYSERDALTGLLNRKTFDDLRFRLREGAAAAATHSASAASPQRRLGDTAQGQTAAPNGPQESWLAMIDIDSFKQINDQFGHLYGDEVLILVANILRQNFRHADRIFRYGGEEFIVLLKESELTTVIAILERLRKAVAAFSFPQVGQVTVSVGFSRADGVVLADLLDQADRALYYVKKNGKNQVAYYQELLSLGKVNLPMQNSEVDLF